MSDELTARDVIARVLKRYPFVADVDMPDHLLAALAAVGKEIVDVQWEWGLFASAHDEVVMEDDDHQPLTEETARASANAHWRVVRRRPAGEWKVAR